MKILTLNTHSLQEENYAQKLEWFIERILIEQPDVIALQEVNQTISAPKAPPHMYKGLISLSHGIPLREDNHAAVIVKRLHQADIPCTWAWLPIKIGYGKYDEGLAVLAINHTIRHAESVLISRADNYANWKTRRILGVQLDGMDDWFYTVHMGWWNDAEEPFQSQWKHLEFCLKEKRTSSMVWLLGDFNSPAEVKAEGYDFIHHSGWKDTYLLAEQKDDGITVAGVIDGWRDKIKDSDSHSGRNGMRIDHIWCSQNVPVISSNIVFNGSNGPVVSDHFGLMIQMKGANES